ncbi:IBR domain protein (macronuclear) [Tetrahymena thermophila SB210]|uniref:RBR-type E3 ubiquitin transferase n=1 Tax=Tetrahymena thermophila (strain SB210) TaxID=312017 RepID=Q229P0_TETTS|nr:IBR domain protein [Tetrahymena thermophila SB210]EAR81998.3 IBR domain protein [Tetrahymena thermophila SB210]|eukprot:XP_001029661.3 IBR domain protein [Tetrahymena thermophila SB210]
MSDGEDYNEDDYYEGEEEYYDDGGNIEEEHNDNLELPSQLVKKQSSVATHKNVEFVLKNEIISRIEKSIEAVQNEQGISSGRALFLLKACKYNVQDTQNIPHKIMDDIYFSETKEATENKNKNTCLQCQKELDKTAFNLECSHRYCMQCAENYITEQFKHQEDENRVCCKCPFASCKERFGFQDFKKLLDEQAFKDYCKFLEDDALKIADYIIRCPSSDCMYVIVQIDQLSLKQSAKSMRCQCRTLFCSSCGSNAHEPLKCSTVKIFNQLEQEQNQIRTLKEKENLYVNKKKTFEYSSFSHSSDFCPNGCPKFLVEKKDNPKVKQCPFCEGNFCIDCKQLYPCKCVEKEESKESMMEAENDNQKSNEKQVELPTVVDYILPLMNTFTACKDNLLYVKVAKRKISAYLQNTLKFVSEKGKYESELNFVHSSLDVLEDLLLFIGHANLFIKIGASSKGDLLKFQLDELQNQYEQLKEALTKDYNQFYKDLKPDDIFGARFQNLKEQVLAICTKVNRNQSSCASDFIGVNLNDGNFEAYFKIYQKESPQALATIKKEQERIDSENKARNSKFGMMGFGDFGGDMMRGGRMHQYGGGHDYHPRGGGYQNRGMPRQKQQQDSDDDEDHYPRGGRQHMQSNMDDSDDDADKIYSQIMETPQQKLLKLLSLVQLKFPRYFEEVRKQKTYIDAFNKLEELKKKDEPIYKSDNILVILPKGIRIINHAYVMNLEQENIQNNKVLQEIINQYKDIFKAFDDKMSKIKEVTPWNAQFFDYFEFLIMNEYKKLKPNEEAQVEETCIACKKPLYPLDDEQFATKILSSSKNISDTDVIIIQDCQHPIHVGCYKPLVTPQVYYKCPCSLEYFRPIGKSIQAFVKDQEDYQYVEIIYRIPNQTINNVQIKAQNIIAYLYPYDETQSQLIYNCYNCYVEAFNRGITFDFSEDGKVQFRIYHQTVAPPRFKQLIQDDRESMYELKKQLENFNIKPNF